MIKVITYGTFDLFHEGHYRLLKRAKGLGDYLIVGITTEGYDRERGKLNVVDSLQTRIANVKKTGFVDEVIIEKYSGQKVDDVKNLGIDIFTVGSDWIGTFDYLKKYCSVVYLDRTINISSTMLRDRNTRIQRVGIIGTGRIANRFASVIKKVSGVNAQAVYNPHTDSARRYAERWNVECCEQLEEFFSCVDIVYIASPHDTHYEYAKKAIDVGKHVICEKPMAMRKQEAEELFALAKEKGVILFEGIKTAYCPGFAKLCEVALSGTIGEIKNVEACFTKLEAADSRELTDRKFGGSFTELGSYGLLPIMKFLGTDYKSVGFDSLYGENGLDIFTRASFVYDNAMATITCGLGVKSEGRLLLSGTKGYIVVDAPWWKTERFEVHYEDASKVEIYSDVYWDEGLQYELSEMMLAIESPDDYSYMLTAEHSIAMAEIMEKFLECNNR